MYVCVYVCNILLLVFLLYMSLYLLCYDSPSYTNNTPSIFPCYTPSILSHRSYLDVSNYCLPATIFCYLTSNLRPLLPPSSLAPTRREKCHNQPILQIRSLANMRLLVPGATKEKVVRYNDCKWHTRPNKAAHFQILLLHIG